MSMRSKPVIIPGIIDEKKVRLSVNVKNVSFKLLSPKYTPSLLVFTNINYI
jgi:hypothetical protein